MGFQLQKKLMNVTTFWYLLGLDKTLSRNPQKARAIQNRNVHKLMKKAYEIPFYRKRFDECHLTPEDFHCREDLAKFPVLTKDELRVWMKELYDQNPDKRDQWDATSTSGSTGIPLRLYQSQREHAIANASWIRILMSFGYNPFFGRMVSFESSYRSEKKKRDSFVQRFGILQRRILSENRCNGDGMKDVIAELNAYHPDLICLRKNCIVRIALYAQQHHLPVKQPKWYIPVSEMVDEMTRSILEKTFGPGLVDAYGSDETGSCIIKRPGNDYYDICNDTHAINIYDENNQLADNGRVIITPLYKTDFPIINYDIGDTASSYEKDGLRYVTKIHGRLNDMVKHENGEATSVLELRKLTNRITGIAQFRFVQESFHKIRIELVRDPQDHTYSVEEINAYFMKRMHELYGEEFVIEIQWLDVIPPDPNGKLRCFVCEV
jgi:phenylacetate-coenzyme A ligase PaaK-like adenylate-forming protein